MFSEHGSAESKQDPGEGQMEGSGGRVVGLCLRPQEKAEDYLDQGGMCGWHLDKDSWFRTVLQMGYHTRSEDRLTYCPDAVLRAAT